MTTEEKAALNRRVSELREPAATLPHIDEGMFCTYMAGESVRSPLRAWYACWNYDEGDIGRWKPRDWTGDATASEVLLEEMPSPCVWRNPNRLWTCEPDAEQTTEDETIETDPERKVAVALAYEKWKESAVSPKGE